MPKNNFAYEASRLCYAQPPSEPTPKADDEAAQQEPRVGPYEPKPTPALDLPRTPKPLPSTPRTDRPLSEYLTRRQAAEFIHDELGRPMSFSTASKLAALGEFAEPALWWGKRPLYTRGSLRTWADARSRPMKGRA
jgi:hypothetical protein